MRAGRPILSTMSSRSFAGIISRILSSTGRKELSVASMRVAAGARTWSYDLAAVDRRKEIATDEEEHDAASARTATNAIGTRDMRENEMQKIDIDCAKSFEALLETAVETGEKPVLPGPSPSMLAPSVRGARPSAAGRS